METLKHIDRFLNSHWEFTVLAGIAFNGMFYRRGYKDGQKAKPTGEGEPK